MGRRPKASNALKGRIEWALLSSVVTRISIKKPRSWGSAERKQKGQRFLGYWEASSSLGKKVFEGLRQKGGSPGSLRVGKNGGKEKGRKIVQKWPEPLTPNRSPFF